jgi:tetratricopeptide (TPR) repeat protein
METQVLLGLIPAACSDSGARTLVIGLGSGFTVSAALAAGAGPTDVVELEPRVVEASRFFHAAGEHPLDDPRVRLVLGDARTHLAHGRRRYGTVVSEPSNPWMAGVNNLFTVDYYHLVRARLEPGGVFCQWLQLYELSPETFASLLASFLEVFPEGHVYSIWCGVELLLVAAPEDARIARERLDTPEVARLLGRAGIESPDQLAAYYGARLASLRAVARGAPLNRDDRPIVEYRAPRDMVAVGRGSLHGDPRVTAAIPFDERQPEGPLYSAWSPERWYSARAGLLVAHGQGAHATAAVRGAERSGLPSLAQQLAREIEADALRQRTQALVEEARGQFAAGRPEDGRRALEQAVELDPGAAGAWTMLAELRRRAGDQAGTEEALAHAATSRDSTVRTEAAIIAANLALERKTPLVAADRYREAQQWNPGLIPAYLLEARARRDGGDIAGARAAVARGLALAPGHPELSALQAELGAAK